MRSTHRPLQIFLDGEAFLVTSRFETTLHRIEDMAVGTSVRMRVEINTEHAAGLVVVEGEPHENQGPKKNRATRRRDEARARRKR